MLDVLGTLKHIFKKDPVLIGNLLFYLQYKWTSLMVIGCSLLVASKQYFGDPIDCMFNGDLPSAMVDTYCWIHATFTLDDAYGKDVGDEIPQPGAGLYKRGDVKTHHTYYQWVCLVLFLQSIGFYAPGYLWKKLEKGRIAKIASLVKEDYSCENGKLTVDDDRGQSEVDGGRRVNVGELLLSDDEEKPEKNTENAGDAMGKEKSGGKQSEATFNELDKESFRGEIREHRCIKVDEAVHCLLLHWDHIDSYARKYIFCELLSFLNVVFQILIVDVFLGGRFAWYGLQVLWGGTSDHGHDTIDPKLIAFPRMTKCIFQVTGHSGQVETYDLLCVIPLNIVNEKIYLVLWFWFMALTLASATLLTYRFLLVTCPPLRSCVFRWRYRSLDRFVARDHPAWRLVAKCRMGQWTILNLLGKNFDECTFGELVGRLGKYEEMKLTLENRENFRKSMEGRSFENVSYAP